MTRPHDVVAIDELRGSVVDAVCFVADYVEIRFVGPVLRCMAHPVRIDRGAEKTEFPGPGAHDALCSLIGATVAEVRLATDKLTLRFDEGAVITAPIDEAGAQAAESIQFVPWHDGRLNVAAMEVL